jgi:hypothetical protein
MTLIHGLIHPDQGHMFFITGCLEASLGYAAGKVDGNGAHTGAFQAGMSQ